MKTSEVLTHAKKHLARNHDEILNTHQQKYICLAIEKAARRNVRITAGDVAICCDIISSRMDRYGSLEGWLALHGCFDLHQPISISTKDQIQAHRHAWLDQMIAEFKAKGD